MDVLDKMNYIQKRKEHADRIFFAMVMIYSSRPIYTISAATAQIEAQDLVGTFEEIYKADIEET